MDYYDVDSGFVSNMGLTLLAGNTFVTAAAADREQYVIVNEKAIQGLKIKTPADAIGQQLWISDTTQVLIAGVVKDFYFRGLATPVTPLLLRNRVAHFNYLTIHTVPGAGKNLVASIEKIWKAGHTGQSFAYTWIKDELHARQSAWGTVSMLAFLALIAVTIACLGLLGMVIYTTETRRKEIGVRKVMGAGVSAIVYLLSKGFLKLVIIAGMIALPVGYCAGYLFLNLFANRITISISMLAGCFAGLVLLVMATIGIRVYRSAVANPVNSLRVE
jgi:putative ABC transport system permease protein